MSTFNHPERRAGEFYLTNINLVNFDSLEIPCRKGTQAYSLSGAPIDASYRMVPVFVDAKWYLEWIATEKGQHCLYGTTVKDLACLRGEMAAHLACLREDVAAQLAFDPKPEVEELQPFTVTATHPVSGLLKPTALRKLLDIPEFSGVSGYSDDTVAVNASATRMAPKCPKFVSPRILEVDETWLTPEAKVLREDAKKQVAAYHAWYVAYYTPVQRELESILDRALSTEAKETPNE